MRNRIFDTLILFFLVLFSLLMFFLVAKFPGTGDVQVWFLWIDNATRLGVAQGYSHSGNMDYPPLSFALLYFNNLLLSFFNLGLLLNLKIMLFIFLMATTGFYYFATKNIYLSILLFVGFFLESAALGYLDILFAPFLLLSLFALKKEQFSIFSLLFTLSCLIKWQPLIISPFLIIYLLNKAIKQKGNRSWFLLKELILPSLLFFLSIYFIFGDTLELSLVYTTSQKFFSGSALNFNWIVTYILHLTNPSTYGFLVNGLNTYFSVNDDPVFKFTKYLFYISYILLLVIYLFSDKNFFKTLLFSMVGFLSYFMFNSGVHENHLFLVVILFAILAAENKKYLFSFIFWTIMFNFNLFLFYGIDGLGFRYRTILGIDLSVLLSVLTFIVFCKQYFLLIPNLYDLDGNFRKIKDTIFKLSI